MGHESAGHPPETREETIGALSEALARQDALFRELAHRVANGFHSVATRLRVEARRIDDPKARSLCIKMAEHVEAMAMVHRRLYQTDDPSKHVLTDYLRALCHDLAASVVHKNIHIKADIHDDVSLNADDATTVGMIVSELIMNAAKHAFNGRKGQIEVRLKRMDNHIELCVADTGVGLPPDFDINKQTGLGMRLMIRQARALDGTLTYTSEGDGTVAKLVFPLRGTDKSHIEQNRSPTDG